VLAAYQGSEDLRRPVSIDDASAPEAVRPEEAIPPDKAGPPAQSGG
jgi:hypothetical protein